MIFTFSPRYFDLPDDAGSDGGGDAAPDDGSQTIIVGSDDSILSIAKANGFWWSTIWNHGNNSALKSLRQKPEVLQEGDKVYVPKPDPKKESKPNEARHKFKLKGEQAKFKIQVMRLDKPRAGLDYTLIIDGNIKTGNTDGSGMIECDIPNDAKGGTLTMDKGKIVYPIVIGQLDPTDSPSGVRQRLAKLGFKSGSDEPPDDMPKKALKAFQEYYELTTSGEFDGATKGKLSDLHPA